MVARAREQAGRQAGSWLAAELVQDLLHTSEPGVGGLRAGDLRDVTVLVRERRCGRCLDESRFRLERGQEIGQDLDLSRCVIALDAETSSPSATLPRRDLPHSARS